MSEEFKKEEINGEAAEETKAAEHTEEVKAETTAEQSNIKMIPYGRKGHSRWMSFFSYRRILIFI